MNRTLHTALPIIAALSVLLAACNSARQTTALQDEQRRQLYNYYYTEGERQRVMDNDEAAFALLSEAARIDTAAPAAQFALANYHAMLGRPDTALYMLRKAAEGDTTQYWYNLLYAQYSASCGLYDESIRTWKRLIRLHPDKPELNSALANVYIANKNIPAAIACYDTMEMRMGMSRDITFKKIELYEQQGDTAAAIADVKKLQQAFPSNTTYMLLLGDLYTMLNRDSAAWEMFQRVDSLEPDNGYLYLSRATFYATHGDSAAYQREMHAALNNPNIDMDTKLGIFREYLSTLTEKDLTKSELAALYESMIEQYPQEPNIRLLYGIYLKVIQQYDAAAEQFGIATDLNPSNAITWNYLLSIYFLQQDYDKSAETGRRALKYISNDANIYEMTALALTLQQRYEEAAQTISTAIDSCSNMTAQQRSSFYGQLGDIYHEMGKTEEAYAQYDTALNYYASNINVLNNYSYFLALENRDLSKAERMSAITIREYPDEPTYLDTYAWILFKKQSYSLARIYIERAIEKSEIPSADILEHYGDILACLGETDNAVEQWEKAILAGGDKERLQKKIDLREYIEE